MQAQFDLNVLNCTNGFRVNTAIATSELGWSVSTAGDVNGDGKFDVVIGAPNRDGSGTGIGVAYVILGQGTFPASLNAASLNGANGFQINGSLVSLLGNSVGTAGDMNGDGKDDLVVGVPETNNAAGTAYVIFG